MKLFYKVMTIMLILISMTAIGCTDVAGDESVNEVSSVEAGTTSEVSVSDDVQQFELVQSQPILVERDYKIYNEWHGRTKEILEENEGNQVKIYSYNRQYLGNIIEVEEYFVVLDVDLIGTCYVDIDSINAISFTEPIHG